MRAALAGGSLAVYNSSLALDLISTQKTAVDLDIPPAKNGQQVLILGAGLAGLACAYELEQKGYHCTILEASHRAGGRNLTLRHGDLIDELGRPNYCDFDKQDNLYFNAGPARIPGHHRRTLHYCKKFKVPLNIKANSNRLAYYHDDKSFTGQPIRQVDYIADARGFLAELVFKSIDKNIFDESLTKEDKQKLEFFARMQGDLNEQGEYIGTERAGATSDRMLTHPHAKKPKDFLSFLHSPFWQDQLNHPEAYDWIEPLMAPKGGMDAIVNGFKKRLKSKIILHAQVQSIATYEDHVEVVYQHEGKHHKQKADFCFNNIPAPLLRGLETNFSEDYRRAIAAIERKDLFKIAFQMRERFWENEGIYGGISYTSQKVAQLWYPSHDINAEKGVMLGAYVWNPKDCEYFANLTPEERLEVAKKQGEKLHPNYTKYIESGVSVAWSRMNHQMGCGNAMSVEDYKQYFKKVQAVHGRHVMVGDQISYHPGWQEGAFASTEPALQQFSSLMRQSAVA